jgi:hypothetical protein
MKTTKKQLRQIAEETYNEFVKKGYSVNNMMDFSKEFETVCFMQYSISIMKKESDRK